MCMNALLMNIVALSLYISIIFNVQHLLFYVLTLNFA